MKSGDNDLLFDCENRPLPVFQTASVEFCREEEGAVPSKSVFRLRLSLDSSSGPKKINAGQFFLLQRVPSGVLLSRAISVFYSEVRSDGASVEFLILKKGKGTSELCSLEKGDTVRLIGPLGNTFPRPEKSGVLIVGGGVGVAPVAGFASTLADSSYDFVACFKSGSYGLSRVKAKNLTITTDDGSVGIKGMVTAALDAQKLKAGGYSVVYACGPLPMLAYIQKICAEAFVKCYISMESRMACGMGACLGCTIKTKEGNKRCCADGPVFDAKILDFSSLSFPSRRAPLGENEEVDLSVSIAGVLFKNPVIAASGTFGYGSEYAPLIDVSSLGGICSKGLTLEPRAGNGGVRLWETSGGLINSIGLENPGVPHFIENELPMMMKIGSTVIANLSGSTLESYVEGAKLLDKTNVPMIELNISCPNVKSGGMAWGMQAKAAGEVVSAVRSATKKPLMVKLSPNAPDLVGVALACVKAGADALSLINTVQAMAIDVESEKVVFDNVKAGFCGPAVKPIALRMVYDVVRAINALPESERVPVVGIGGISTWQDAVEFILAGACAIEVGTATFFNPSAMSEIVDGLKAFMKRKGYKSIRDFCGKAQA